MTEDASASPRLAQPGDLDGLLPLVAEFCAIDGHDYDPARVRKALRPLLLDDRLGLVWLLGEPPAGYAVITWSYSLESGGVDALLDEFYVRQRGRGLGSQAIGVILEDLRHRGITRIFLETEIRNEAARRFYARHGFATEPSVWMSADL
jgi:GNAT superfamily N-acetyltransferase